MNKFQLEQLNIYEISWGGQASPTTKLGWGCRGIHFPTKLWEDEPTKPLYSTYFYKTLLWNKTPLIPTYNAVFQA